MLGGLCSRDSGKTYAWCRSNILELVRCNLNREIGLTQDEAAQIEQQNTQKLFEKLGSSNVVENVRMYFVLIVIKFLF